MTDPVPSDDATDRWGLLFHSGLHYAPHHTRQEWARIADAIRTADSHAESATRAGDPVERGDPRWCRFALDTYDMLNASGAYWHVDYGQQPVCVSDEHIIRAWLDAPWVPAGDEPMTMLEANSLDLQFEPGRTPDHTCLTFLVEHAQERGVFGAPGHRFGLHCWTENGDMRTDAFGVTARTPDGTRLRSPMLTVDELVIPGRPAVDTVVGVLQGVAKVANELLDAHARTVATPAAPSHARTADRAHDPVTVRAETPPVTGDGAFPPLRLGHPAALAAPPELRPPEPGRRR